MGRKRKSTQGKAGAKPVTRTSSVGAVPQSSPRSGPPIVANPPRRHRGFLIVSAAAVAVWMMFLLYMAQRN